MQVALGFERVPLPVRLIPLHNRKVARLLDMFLLGSEDGGCVITPFDQRWLDPTFRSIYEEARGQEVEP